MVMRSVANRNPKATRREMGAGIEHCSEHCSEHCYVSVDFSFQLSAFSFQLSAFSQIAKNELKNAQLDSLNCFEILGLRVLLAYTVKRMSREMRKR